MEHDEEDFRKRVLEKVPQAYHQFLDVFSKAESDTITPYRIGVDYKIELTKGAKPEDLGYSPLYKLSAYELETYKKYIEEHLYKGFIEPNSAL